MTAGKQRYELELIRFQTERKLRSAEEAVKQAESDLYLSKEKLLNYETGLRVLLDRFSGRKAEKLEKLQGDIRRAQALRDARRREREALEQTIRQTEADLSALPGWQELDAPAWEARFCAQMLTQLLEDNYEALEEARKTLRGERMDQIMSAGEFQSYYGAADRTGEACAKLLARLKELGFLNEVPSYYLAPTAYTANAAAGFIRLERVGSAMDQCVEMQSAVRKLLQYPEADE